MGAQEKDPVGVALARVARLCSLPIGVLAWRAPEPTLTVVVKATFDLNADGAATLAAAQEPLSIDRPARSGSFGDLDRACDFIPLKARVDLLLTGHARAAAALDALPAGFAVDKLHRRFYAVADEPTDAAPLLPEYLRSSAGDATRVGPRALWAGTLDGAAIVGDDGVPCVPIPRGFDYAAFNVAPPEQQIELLSLTAQITLDGLTADGRRTARLPGIRPRVFVLPEGGFDPLWTPEEVVLRCDTLWIDSDRALCVLTWRGVVPLAPNARGAPSLVLALDEGNRKKTWARALTALDGAPWTAATEPDDARQAAALALDDSGDRDDDDDGPITDRMQRGAAAITIDDDPSTLRPGSIPDSDDDDEPAAPITRAPLMVLGGLRSSLASFEEKRPPGRPQRPAGLQLSRIEDDDTAIAIERPVPLASAPLEPPRAPPPPAQPPRASMTLPFAKLPPAQPPRASMTLPFAKQPSRAVIPFSPSTTLALDPAEPPRAMTLPFMRGPEPSPAALPFQAPSKTAPPFARTNTITLDSSHERATSALPFTPSEGLMARMRGAAPSLPALGDLPSAPPPPAATPAASWLLAPAPPRTVGESITSAADAAPAVAQAPLAPAVEAAPSAFTMEQYAEIKAEIWGSRATVANVLQLHDRDEATFHDHERRLADALAREAAEGRSTLAIALRDALQLARDRRQSTGERPLRTLEVAYVTLLAALDRADDPSAILAAKGMSPAEWRRLRRRFEERTGADAKLRDALSTKLAAARKVVGDETGSGSKWWNRREATPARAKRVPAKPKAPG